jgi:hypothetical protein
MQNRTLAPLIKTQQATGALKTIFLAIPRRRELFGTHSGYCKYLKERAEDVVGDNWAGKAVIMTQMQHNNTTLKPGCRQKRKLA